MTPEQHNKYLAWAHLVHGGILGLFTLGFLAMFGVMFIGILREPVGPNGSQGPPAFFLIFWLLFVALYLAFTIPSFIAGYALLKRKSWAKLASIIGAVIAAMFFPIGTAVCVYTFWFLFSEPGKKLYDPPSPSLLSEGTEPIDQRAFHGSSSYAPPDWR